MQVGISAGKYSVNHGFLLFDKPTGLSSRYCVDVVQKAFPGLKAGHAGTLDPFATGLLPVCIGRSTKLVEFLRKGDKTYSACLTLGFSTDTLDHTGEILEQRDVSNGLSLSAIQSAAEQFVGFIDQIPPMYSARKKNGIRLYKLARSGIEVDRSPRRIEIKAMVIESFSSPDIHFTVTCSEGTYVRSLGAELAEKLGSIGTLTALRRIRVGRFDLDQAVRLDFFQKAVLEGRQSEYLFPSDLITSHLSALILHDHSIDRFMNGCLLTENDFDSTDFMPVSGQIYNLYDQHHRFLGVIENTGRVLNGKSLLKTMRLTDIC